MSYARRPPDPWYIWNDGDGYCFNGADTLDEEPKFYRVPASAIELLFARMPRKKRRAAKRDNAQSVALPKEMPSE